MQICPKKWEVTDSQVFGTNTRWSDISFPKATTNRHSTLEALSPSARRPPAPPSRGRKQTLERCGNSQHQCRLKPTLRARRRARALAALAPALDPLMSELNSSTRGSPLQHLWWMHYLGAVVMFISIASLLDSRHPAGTWETICGIGGCSAAFGVLN